MPPPCEIPERLEALARRVTRLADCSIRITSQTQYDDLEEEADAICRGIKAAFRGEARPR